MAGVGRGEAERLLAVHDRLAEAEGQADDALLGLLVAHRIEVQRPGDAGKRREPQAVVLAAAHFLQDDGHLLLGDHVAGGQDVASGGSVIHRGVYALDGLGDEPQLLVLVFRRRDHAGGIDAGERLVVRVFQLGGRPDGERLADVADKDAEGLRQVLGQGGGDEFREDLLVGEVRVDDVLEAVLEDEPVEESRRDHQGAGDQHAHTLPFVVQVVALEHLVQESEAAGLAAQGTVAQAGEADGVVVAFGLEAGHHAQPLRHPVAPDGADRRLPAFRRIVEMAFLDLVSHLEQAAGQQPAGNVVLGGQAVEVLVRDGGEDALGPVQVAGAGGFLAGLGIGDDEVAESEFPADEFRQVVVEGLGPLDEEAGLQGFGHRAHAFLRGLHQDGHLGVVLADHPAQVDARVQLLLRGLVAPVQDEADVGDDAQHVALVFLVQGHGVVVVRGHQDLRTGPLAEALLALVEGVPDGFAVLQEDETVQLGEIDGVEADRVLHQEDALHAVLQDVHGRVPAVLQELDDGDDQVRGVVPAEDAVEMAQVVALHLLVDLLREGGQQDDGGFRVDGLDAL